MDYFHGGGEVVGYATVVYSYGTSIRGSEKGEGKYEKDRNEGEVLHSLVLLRNREMSLG